MSVIGIMSPGDMGHAIGRELRRHGMDVIASVSGRSERTQHLSKQAGIREVQHLQQFVTEADLILSILVPANAESAANEVARAIQSSESAVHYVDCNAVSPETAQRIGQAIRKEGGEFSDASIIGLPPGTAATPRLYVSGPNAEAIKVLDGLGVVVKTVGEEIGQASGIKMCYAALTKGTFALNYALAIVADRLGLLDDLLAEFESSQPEVFQRMHQFLPRLPAKAWRWIGEMEQIASTFEDTGVTPKFHDAAAEIYRLICETTLGTETPETIDQNRTLEATIATISEESDNRNGRK
jgi:3-hydroxyisobutyrate dehydrogenase-like beta-hydroxyacid dehydrogenase